MALTDNLLAAYNFDGNSNDSFGANNGTDVSIVYNSSYGKINQGALIDAATDKISFADWGLGTGDFTVSIWMKPITSLVNGTNIVFSKQANTPSYGVYWGLIINTGLFEFDHYDGSTDNFFFGTTSVSLGTYYHLVVTRAGDTVSLYVNNSLEASQTGYATRNFGGAILNGLGNQVLNAATGNYDILQVWKGKALSAGEISQLYNGGAGLQYPFTTPTTNSNFLMFT